MWLAETWFDVQGRMRQLPAGRRERLNHAVTSLVPQPGSATIIRVAHAQAHHPAGL